MAIAGKLALGGAEFCQPCVRYLHSDSLKVIATNADLSIFSYLLIRVLFMANNMLFSMKDNFIDISFGLFGGLGLRSIDVCPHDRRGLCDSQEYVKTQTNMRHELGIEFILGYLSLYISERNFHRIGGGIGLVLWKNREWEK